MHTEKMSLQTTAVHAGARKDDSFGSVNQPIYMTSNYRLPADGSYFDPTGIEDFVYQRERNVNMLVLQEKMCGLADAEDCVVFGSGMAALSSVFTTFLSSGDHAVVSKVCYVSTEALFREALSGKYGVEVTFVDTADIEAVKAAIRPNTRLIHMEVPGNPTTEIGDVEAAARLAHANGALLSVDATFGGLVCFRPRALGADLEIHSMTKYINGHGDTLGGCVLGKKELVSRVRELCLVKYGGVLSPFNAWLIARGLVTLPIRMQQHCHTAQKVAEFLRDCPAVRFVWYPGLPDHPQHALASKVMTNGYSAMMTWDIRGDRAAHYRFLSALKLVSYAVSLGDVETLITYNESGDPKLQDYPAPFREGFFRFSLGLEDPEDVIADLTQAMKTAGVL